MTHDSQNTIRITDLLREREALFVRVHECESVMERILGQPYSGLTVPPLPSLAKRKKIRPAKERDSRPSTLRKLRKGEENIYLVAYEQDGVPAQSTQRETALLQLLVDSPPPGFRIRKIDTACIDDGGIHHVIQTVYTDDL
jgi:hypothetical protein